MVRFGHLGGVEGLHRSTSVVAPAMAAYLAADEISWRLRDRLVETSASPIFNSVITVATSTPGLARKVSAAARTAAKAFLLGPRHFRRGRARRGTERGPRGVVDFVVPAEIARIVVSGGAGLGRWRRGFELA